jgi:hypothetical protein
MAASAKAAAEASSSNSNNNVSNKSERYMPIMNNKGEQVEYIFDTFVQFDLYLKYVDNLYELPNSDIRHFYEYRRIDYYVEKIIELFDEKKICKNISKAFMLERFKSKNTIFVFVQHLKTNAIMGFAAMYLFEGKKEKYVMLDLICSNTDYKRVGSALMNYIHMLGRQVGATYVSLEAAESAVGFYKKKKYRIVETGFKTINIPMRRRITRKKPASNKPAAGAGAK